MTKREVVLTCGLVLVAGVSLAIPQIANAARSGERKVTRGAPAICSPNSMPESQTLPLTRIPPGGFGLVTKTEKPPPFESPCIALATDPQTPPHPGFQGPSGLTPGRR